MSCVNCSSTSPSKRWDLYFHQICETVAFKSPCLSRQIGSLLVRDHSVISTGFNGPPRGIPHCGMDRLLSDTELAETMHKFETTVKSYNRDKLNSTCPRKLLGYESGTHMELCPAQHAEENAVSNAARLGVSVIGSICYLNSVIPCQKCFGTLINAGVVEIVCDDLNVYDKFTKLLIDNSNIKIRKFDLGA